MRSIFAILLLLAVQAGGAHAALELCYSRQSALVSAAGFVSKLTDLKAGTEYVEAELGFITISEVAPDGSWVSFKRRGDSAKTPPAKLSGPSLERWRVVETKSDAARVLGAIRTEAGWNTGNVAALYALDALSDQVANFQQTNIRGQVKFPETAQRYEALLHEVDRAAGTSGPGLVDSIELWRGWFRDTYSKNRIPPEGLDRMRRFMVLVRDRTGVDLVQVGALKGMAERGGGMPRLGLADKRKIIDKTSNLRAPVDVPGNSPVLVGRSTAVVPADVRDTLLPWMWDHGVEGLAMHDLGTGRGPRVSNEISLGDYVPTDQAGHENHSLTQDILKLKNGQSERLPGLIADAIVNQKGQQIDTRSVDMVIAIPTRDGRVDAADLVGRAVAQKIGKPYEAGALTRDAGRPPQKDQPNVTQRMWNAAGMFKGTDATKFRGKRVLIIDDVSATGTTVAEARRIVLEGGGEPVVVVVGKSRPGN